MAMAPVASPGVPWRPRQLHALTWAAAVGAVLLRAWILLGGGVDGGALASVGAAALGQDAGASLLERPLARAAAVLAPLEFWPLAVALLLLWVGYCVAAVLACRALVADPRARLVLLIALVYSPMALPGMATWPFGATQASLAIGFLLIAAGAAAYLRTGRMRSTIPVYVGAVVAFAGAAPTPWSPAFLVLPWAAVLLLVPRASHAHIVAAPRLPRALVLAVVAGLGVVWAFASGGRPIGELPRDTGRAASYVGEAIATGALPGFAGGPLAWVGGFGPWPAAQPPIWIVVIGIQVVLLALASSLFLTHRGLLPWGVGAGFAIAALVMIPLGAPIAVTGTGAQGLGLAVAPALLVVAVAAALERPVAGAVAWPQRVRRLATDSRRRFAALLAVDAFIALSVVSSIAWSDSRPEYLGEDFVLTARSSLAEASADVPILPQVVPPAVVDPGLAPLNTTDVVFAPLASRPAFGTWTTRLQALDDTGVLRPASVKGIDVAVDCETWAPEFAVTPALPEFAYIAQIDLAEASPGGFSVGLGDALPVTIPSGMDDRIVFVQLIGSGSTIRFTPLGDTPVCIDRLLLGQAAVDSIGPDGGSQ